MTSSNENEIVSDVYSNSVKVTKIQWLKLILFTPILVPMRIIILFFSFAISGFLSHIILYGLSEEERKSKPIMQEWKKILKSIISYNLKVTAFLCGFRMNVEGKLSDDSEAPIQVIAPHTSFMDITALITLGRDGFIISRKENESIIFVGKMIQASQSISVERTDPQSKSAARKELDRRLNSALWPKLAIFPEGTTTNGKALVQFKNGAFVGGKPVQPTLLTYPNNGLDTVTWTWKQNLGYLKLIWMTLATLWTNCRIQHLPVYYPSKAEKADPKLYANNVRKVMAAALGIPTTEQLAQQFIENCSNERKKD